MTKLEQAARQALETLERASDAGYSVECDETITALREALEQVAPRKTERWNPMYSSNAKTALQMAAVIAHRDTEAAPLAEQTVDPDGEAFRTAARLGLTLRFYGACAQSSMPGTPSAYVVTHGGDRAEAMREAVEKAAAIIASGGEAPKAPLAPPAEQQAQPGAVGRTGCTAGTDEECTRRGCATSCPSQQAAPKAAPGEPVASAAKDAIMGAAYDFRDAHISGSMNLKRSAHAILEAAVDNALAAQAAPQQQAPVQVSTQWLAEMIMSDCGCSTQNQRLLDRIIERITQYESANTTPPAEQQARYSRLHDADALHGQQLNVYGTATTTEAVTPEGGATTEAALGAEQAAPKAAPEVGNSGFDYKTAADFLNGKTVSDEAVRKFVAASRWAHDERAALSATLLAMHGVLTSREAEIALLKKALLEAEAAPQPAPAPASESIDQLARKLEIIGVVGVVDGHDVVRRESVLEIARRAALAAQGGRDAG